jgi:hypothetical protein
MTLACTAATADIIESFEIKAQVFHPADPDQLGMVTVSGSLTFSGAGMHGVLTHTSLNPFPVRGPAPLSDLNFANYHVPQRTRMFFFEKKNQKTFVS